MLCFGGRCFGGTLLCCNVLALHRQEWILQCSEWQQKRLEVRLCVQDRERDISAREAASEARESALTAREKQCIEAQEDCRRRCSQAIEDMHAAKDVARKEVIHCAAN